jgi:hypothetical protein
MWCTRKEAGGGSAPDHKHGSFLVRGFLCRQCNTEYSEKSELLTRGLVEYIVQNAPELVERYPWIAYRARTDQLREIRSLQDFRGDEQRKSDYSKALKDEQTRSNDFVDYHNTNTTEEFRRLMRKYKAV